MIGGRFAAGDRLNEFEEAVGGGWSWTSSAEVHRYPGAESNIPTIYTCAESGAALI